MPREQEGARAGRQQARTHARGEKRAAPGGHSPGLIARFQPLLLLLLPQLSSPRRRHLPGAWRHPPPPPPPPPARARPQQAHPSPACADDDDDAH
eukprot:scaffold4316_cov326-Prasinococcus_capsulatus_cf.AAC.1